MSYSLKGFIANPAVANNQDGAIARFGELALLSQTYSTHTQTLAKTTYPNIVVMAFSNIDSLTNTQQQVTTVYANFLLEFSAWLYDVSTTFNAQTTQQDVVAAIVNRFGTKVTNVTADPLDYDGQRYMPTKVTYTLHLSSVPDMGVVLWTADTEFRSQYDEYEVRVVSPVDNVDIFLSSYAVVQEAVKGNNSSADIQRIAVVRGLDPETSVVPVEVIWADPTNPTNIIPITFYAVTYGPRGATLDASLSAVVQYILANSSEDDATWRIVFPDLFRITRFAFFPQWGKAALEGRTGQPTIYSPFASQLAITAARSEVDNLMPSQYYLNGMEAYNHPYRSLSLILFPGTDNRAGSTSLYQAYPDYIAAETGTPDYNRQSEKTKRFSDMIGELIRQSENYGPTVVPALGYRVVVFKNVKFISTKYNNTEFIMKTRVQ